jgi:hypothetical protein
MKNEIEVLADEILLKAALMKRTFGDFNIKFQEDFSKFKENSMKLLKLIERDKLNRLSKCGMVITDIPQTLSVIGSKDERIISKQLQGIETRIQDCDKLDCSNLKSNKIKPEIKYKIKDCKVVLNRIDLKTKKLIKYK